MEKNVLILGGVALLVGLAVVIGLGVLAWKYLPVGGSDGTLLGNGTQKNGSNGESTTAGNGTGAGAAAGGTLENGSMNWVAILQENNISVSDNATVEVVEEHGTLVMLSVRSVREVVGGGEYAVTNDLVLFDRASGLAVIESSSTFLTDDPNRSSENEVTGPHDPEPIVLPWNETNPPPSYCPNDVPNGQAGECPNRST